MKKEKQFKDGIPNKFYWNYKYHIDNNKLPDGIMDFETLKVFFDCHNEQIKEARKELIEEFKTEGYRKRIFSFGYDKAIKEFGKLIDECSIPIMNEEEMEKFILKNTDSSIYRVVNYDELKQQLQKLNKLFEEGK